jgi:RimJ/RimL family protein N-acetyltransferase
MSVILAPCRLDYVLDVARLQTTEERAVLQALSGVEYDAEQLAVQYFTQPGIHFSGFSEDGELLAVAGFTRIRDGVFRTWFLATERAWDPHGRGLTKLVKQTIARMLGENLARRIETVTLASENKARRWYEQIGLSYESTLRGYANDGADAVMYVALQEKR